MNRLLHLKKTSSLNDELSNSQVKGMIIVGNDFSALKALEMSLKKNPENNIVIINERGTSAEEIIKSTENSVLLGRGETFSHLFESKRRPSQYGEPYFYKDQTLKPFSGRAKPHKLLEFESYFSDRPYEFEYRNFFDDFENLNQEYDKRVANLLITEITKSKENGNWVVKYGDGSTHQTEKLLWCDTRKRLFDVLTEDYKKSLNDKEVQFLLENLNYSFLTVYFRLEEKVSDQAQTIFIPQSFTYDLGHFIVDLSQPQGDTQQVRASAIIYEESLGEEELGSKIKHLKKSLQKVYPNFFERKLREEVSYSKNYLCAKREVDKEDIDDDLEGLPSLFGREAQLKSEMKKPEISTLYSVFNSISEFQI